MKIGELLADAIKYDQSLLAHAIYWALSNNKCMKEDMDNKFFCLDFEFDEIKKLEQENILGMQIIKVYIMPISNESFLVVLAENEKSARSQFYLETHNLPQKIFDITNKMETNFYDLETKEYKTIWQEREETVIFPKTVMVIDK